jgi:hypothetical protein
VFDDVAVGPIAFITDRGKMTPVPMLGALAQA